MGNAVATAAPSPDEDRAWSPEIIEIGEAIMNLTLLKAVELSDYMEEVHGIKSACGVPLPPPNQENNPNIQKAPEKTEFTVMFEGVADPSKKINVIKVAREITGLGLKEAKELIENAPKPIRENVTKDEAEKIKAKLEEGGGKVSLQ